MPNPTAKTVALPSDVFAHLSTLKIRLAGTLNRIPTNGEVIESVLSLGETHYEELTSLLKQEAK